MQINLTSRQLRAFVLLSEQRSFTRAAASMPLSQPAFSALIGQLEAVLGLRLFDRSTRSVSLTHEGRTFEASARRLLDEMDSAVVEMRDHADGRRGRVTVALLPSLAAAWLPAVLAGFQAEHPGIEVQVVDVLSEPCIEAVRTGRADLALAATRADTPELRADRFCSDGFHLVCPARHPLLKVPNPKPADLAAWPFIHLSRTSSVRQVLEAATYPRPMRSVLEVDQLATVAGMVRAGLGVSLVPGLSLYQFDDAALRTRPVDWPGLRRHIYAVRRRDQGLSIAAETLYAFMRARAPVEAKRR